MARADHICVHFTKFFVHHGIDCGDGTVIHYDGERIVQTPIATFGGGNQYFVKRYGQCDSDDVVIQRAKSRLGESKYSLLFNNCEHFATWCKTGLQDSEQVRNTGAAAGGATGTAAGLSGAGITSGLATVGGVVGGSAVAGVMVSASAGGDDSNLIRATLEWIADAGINGLGVLPSAEEVAADHLSKAASVEDAINSVIAWRTTYAAGTGFITGLGGIAAMPITIPAGLAASYALGANTAAAIAHLRGYDIHSEQVRTMVLLCLIGEAGEEILKTAGIRIGTKLSQNLIKQIPGKVLIEINKKIGFRLITKAGEKGVVNLMKMVPLVGGIVGGTFDGLFVNACGKTAKNLFKPQTHNNSSAAD